MTGDSPPLHFHHTEDEAFYVLAGELRIRVGHADVLVAAAREHGIELVGPPLDA